MLLFFFYRAKPRVSAVVGRRTYTEEELQNALQDIMSGKLGTRRAAVIYGIPRSTLRNKVYKLAMEQKREASLLPQSTVLDVLDPDDEEKELSGDEDRDLDKPISRLYNSEEMLRSPQSTVTTGISNKFGQMYENSSPKLDIQSAKDAKLQDNTPSTPPITNNPWLEPIVLQNIILASGLMQQKMEDPNNFQEMFRSLMLHQQELMKEQLKKTVSAPSPTDHLNNGKPNATSDPTRQLMHNLQLFQQQQLQNRLIKSETPDPVGAVDLNDSEDSAVILKIPSFKPVAGSSSSSGKNGENTNDSTPQTTPPLHSRSPQTHMTTGISPPIIRQNNESQSPPISIGSKGMLSLREVIAKSISRTFNQQNPETMNKPSIDHLEQYKRPSISVIKNLGGTDMSRFGASPNLMAMNSNNSQSLLNNSGGKGTRPKRGKYRNYDRDSLVEAVKAVQRGEMSVHRAGSYYGVPHSTLEYKVKERHLMRPRKREPKPQPLDATGSSTSSSSLKPHEISGSAAANLRTLDKSKSLPSAKAQMKTPPFPSTSPNGLKMGIFDPSQLTYPPQLFWPPGPAYGGLPIDFAQRSSGTNATYPAESFLASQMMRMQEGVLRQANATNPKTPTPSLSNASAAAAAATSATNITPGQKNQTKSEHEIAIENLYDGSGVNGSFLDGIIRHSLDRKPNDSIPHGALLDQLVKNNRHSISSDGDCNNGNNNKRPGSPFNFAHHGIKRERNSSSSGDTDRESVDERDISKE